MIPRLRQGDQGICHRRCPGCQCQSGHAAFQRCDSLLQNPLCRVGQTAVNVAGILQAEAVCCVLAVMEYIGCGLVDRNRSGIRCRIRVLLSYVQLQCVKSKLSICSHFLYLYCPFVMFRS